MPRAVRNPTLHGLSRRGLLLRLGVFLIALLLPSAVLIYNALGQMKWEVFHQHQTLARDLSLQIDERLQLALREEERRPFSDYSFEVPVDARNSNLVRRSPLASLSSGSALPGLVGYFQVDPEGFFSTPLLPVSDTAASERLSAEDDRSGREALARRIQAILLENELLRPGRDVRDEALATTDSAVSQPPSRVRGGLGSSLQSLSDARLSATVSASGVASEAGRAGTRQDEDAENSADTASLAREEATSASRAPRYAHEIAGARATSGAGDGEPAPGPAAEPGAQAKVMRRLYERVADEGAAQAGFDQLNTDAARVAPRKRRDTLGRVDELDLQSPFADKESVEAERRASERQVELTTQRARARSKAEAVQQAAEPLAGRADETPGAGAGAALPRLPLPGPSMSERPLDDNVRPASPPPVPADPGVDAWRQSAPAPEAPLAESREPAGPREPADNGVEARARRGVSGQDAQRIRTFENEIDPLELSLLGSGHFVLFRKVWKDGRRFVQGALIERKAFLDALFARAFETSALARMSKLAIAYEGDLLNAFSGQGRSRYVLSSDELQGSLLYRGRLSKPFSELELIYTITRLPAGPGARVVLIGASVLLVVLVVGVVMMYRLGAKQIDLSRQQQDFVSAVSHELKTPLTSIRMYGEMLQAGWASEDRKQVYYAYIHDESERLSRLIDNVLQLARMTRNDLRADLRAVTLAQLHDGVRSKIASQVERSGFELVLTLAAEDADTKVLVDTDFFSQIVINLVDNAIKFSARAERKRIEIDWQIEGRDPSRGDGSSRTPGRVCFGVRDHGPGVPAAQVARIFRLFYRAESELTRETVGTGIGLALVNQLARCMGASVDVRNRDPGAQFLLYLGIARDTTRR
ncbi:MAG: hypothetical protein KDK91_08800 [Gammaproteobacteria bacterium]|nr:hypothetical protein [Gammaproteobacteria bacterium]